MESENDSNYENDEMAIDSDREELESPRDDMIENN